MVQQQGIRFGTDGWRGIIADRFTFANVDRVARAAAQVLAANFGHLETRRIMVGYDRRFLSDRFARCAAEAIAEQGYEVYLAQNYCSTPAMSWAAFSQRALGAVVITASHNPPEYNGFKIKGAFGGSVPKSVTEQVEKTLAEEIEKRSGGSITTFDPWSDYAAVLQKKVDLEKIKESFRSGKVKVLVNPMYGAASGGLGKILGELPGLGEINNRHDPLFGGVPPEPIAKYLGDFCQQVQQLQGENPDRIVFGLAFDGDGDRIAAVDGEGNYLSSQVLIPVLIEHLHCQHGLLGQVVKTISGSDLIPRVAQLYNLPVVETAIGFKYIATEMLKGGLTLLGGEESGGIGYGNHIPERDALLSALYVLEAVVTREKDIPSLYRALQEKANFYSAYDRIDITVKQPQTLIDTLAKHCPDRVADRSVLSVQTIDGFKLRLEGDSWLLIRFSGTEPLLRLYSEAPTIEEVRQILQWIREWVEKVDY
ncbi:MAG: phosphoglucomutase/phosphomannomutase family protein [Pseudanabaenaceae cyanobacterium SKYGB_i_bin29]|nr:phosphoglucomutase/phosphomannomutase family protein [Pseudanabaenaceae cyanobacterium SKYG29]MDW8422599.1 phosphoglucomutase/phosphomannomutase family protein [Pseudanabaenaceae cyanobacterium SKYGB_i_bin29]